MRLTNYEHRGHRHCGVITGDAVRPLPDGTTLFGLIHSGLSGPATDLPPLGDPIPVAGVRLLPPLEPPSVHNFVTFEEHVEGVRRPMNGPPAVPEAWYDAPTFYFTNPAALIGAHDDVPVPPGGQALGDFELEVPGGHRPRVSPLS